VVVPGRLGIRQSVPGWSLGRVDSREGGLSGLASDLVRRAMEMYPPGRRVRVWWHEKRRMLPGVVVSHYPHFMLVRVDVAGGTWLTALTWADVTCAGLEVPRVMPAGPGPRSGRLARAAGD